MTQKILKHFIMKKLEKLKDKSLSVSKLGLIKAGGEECTGGGFSSQYDWNNCTTYTYSWQSDTVDNGIYTFSGGKTTIHRWTNCSEVTMSIN